MLISFIITNFLGESIEMELRRPEKSGFLIKSVSGLGPSKADVNTTAVSTNDGSLYNSARLQERNIVFDILFRETEQGESIEAVRQKSYKYFPIKKNLVVTIVTDNRIVQTLGYVESNEPSIFSATEGAKISIVCPDPYFYSAGESHITVFSGIEPRFQFPFSNNSLTNSMLVMGAIQNKTENVVIYNGDAEIGVVIRIHAIGTVSTVTIYNIRTRESMGIDTTKLATLTGSGIINGDDIIINTMKGSKSITLIRAGVETNILNCLVKNSDWFSLAKGDNLFAFTAVSGTTNLQFRVENLVIFEGV